MIKAPSRHCARNQHSLVLHTEFRSRGYRLSRHRSGIRNRHIVGFGVQKTITIQSTWWKSIHSINCGWVVECENGRRKGDGWIHVWTHRSITPVRGNRRRGIWFTCSVTAVHLQFRWIRAHTWTKESSLIRISWSETNNGYLSNRVETKKLGPFHWMRPYIWYPSNWTFTIVDRDWKVIVVNMVDRNAIENRIGWSLRLEELHRNSIWIQFVWVMDTTGVVHSIVFEEECYFGRNDNKQVQENQIPDGGKRYQPSLLSEMIGKLSQSTINGLCSQYIFGINTAILHYCSIEETKVTTSIVLVRTS